MNGTDFTAPVLPADHPRVFIQKADIPALREKIKKPALSDAYAAFLSRLSEPADGTLAHPSGSRFTNADSHKLGVIECYALSYLLDGDEARGRAAIDAVLTYHREIVHYDYNTQGQELFTLGLVYDWCYALLSEREKDIFFRAVEQTASGMEMGYPHFSQGFVTGHGVEGQLMRDLMCAAIAMADEHPALYQNTAKLFFTEMVKAKRYLYSFGAYPQGTHYISYRMQWEYLATRLWDGLGIDHVFGEQQKEPLYWFFYMMRGDGISLFDGDDHKNNLPLGEPYHLMYRPYFHAASYEHDGYCLSEALRERPENPFRESGNQSLNAVEYLLCADPDLQPKPISDLPLSRYFGHPRGELIARTGWDSDSVVCQMKINHIHTGNHQHLDGGAFQIYYHGYLATDSGYYQAFRNSDNRNPASGNTNYNSQHFLSYYQRTVAHNCMLVFDPNEKVANYDRTDLSNDGGQRYPDNGKEAKTLDMLLDPAFGHRVGEVLAYRIDEGENPRYSYLKGDLTDAYTEKVTGYCRSFVFLPLCEEADKAALVVYDRIASADASFKKTWLLHTLEEPILSGDTYAAADTREGYGGELTLKTLLPKEKTVKILGNDEVFRVGDVNYVAKTLEGNRHNEGGGYRLEITPKNESIEDTFLNVCGIGDRGKTHVASSYLKTETHEGALVGKNVVLFGTDKNPSAKPQTVRTESDCQMLLVLDLVPGVWYVNDKPYEVDTDGVLTVLVPPRVCHIKREEP